LVFSTVHWVASSLAAISTLILVFLHPKKYLRPLSYSMVFFAALGLADYIVNQQVVLAIIDSHTIHAWVGIAALSLSLLSFASAFLMRPRRPRAHCRLGYAAAVFSAAALFIGVILLGGVFSKGPVIDVEQQPASSVLPEIEATEFLGIKLTPLSDQRNNAIKGTQYIDRQNYTLRVRGLVDRELNMTYDELLQLPTYSEVSYMPCVEGWGFTAKWTGFRVIDLLNLSVIRPSGIYVVFRSYDDYSTGLPLDYLQNGKILMAFGINDLTLPADRGFPLQLVARDKYGYKWAKWITEIEVVSEEVRGYWESRGYSDSANVGEFPFQLSLR